MGNKLTKKNKKNNKCAAKKDVCSTVCYSYGIWTNVLPNLTNLE